MKLSELQNVPVRYGENLKNEVKISTTIPTCAFLSAILFVFCNGLL